MYRYLIVLLENVYVLVVLQIEGLQEGVDLGSRVLHGLPNHLGHPKSKYFRKIWHYHWLIQSFVIAICIVFREIFIFLCVQICLDRWITFLDCTCSLHVDRAGTKGHRRQETSPEYNLRNMHEFIHQFVQLSHQKQ